MPHDGGVEGYAKAVNGFVEHYRHRVADIPPDHLSAGAEHQSRFDLKLLVGEDMEQGHHKFGYSGDEGGQGRALHPQGGSAQLAEDEYPVQKGVDDHGGDKDVKARLGVCHGPVGRHIDRGDAVKEEGEGHDPGVFGRQGHHGGVVAEQPHKLIGKEKEDGAEKQGNEGSGVKPDAQHPVDGVVILLAIELAHQHGPAALQAEGHQHDDHNGSICHGDGRHGRLSQQAHHKGIQQAQRGGDHVLQYHGNGQGHHAFVKSGALFHIGKHKTLLKKLYL